VGFKKKSQIESAVLEPTRAKQIYVTLQNTWLKLHPIDLQPVDYDHGEKTFNMTAYARDPDPGVNNEKRASTTIIVHVTDDNDEVPTFDPVDPVTVAEDAEVGKLLATVTATDQDVNDDFNQFE